MYFKKKAKNIFDDMGHAFLGVKEDKAVERLEKELKFAYDTGYQQGQCLDMRAEEE